MCSSGPTYTSDVWKLDITILLQVILPALGALMLGWFLVIVFFGKYHTEYAKNIKFDPSS